MNRTEEFKLLDGLFDELFPIMRSITGPGIEQSIEIFKRHMPLELSKVPSGSQVFDWTVPQEWHFKSAQLIGPNNEIICDANIFNLHVVNYSVSIDKKMTLEELLPHIHVEPKLPDAIPYVTSYYNKNWGFCLSQNQKNNLKEGIYQVKIDTEFVNGGVPFAQCTLPGESKREILLTSYLCHPSLANNELSGPLVLLALFNRIKKWKKRRFTYRFLLNPETIGSICFLHENGRHLKENLESGLVLTCLGGPSEKLNYKQSRGGNFLIDKVLDYKKDTSILPIKSTPFTATGGSDERQFCSPGFNLPIGQISRTKYLQYDGYHNSYDDKAFMGIDNIIESTKVIEDLLKLVEISGNPVNLTPFGEPQLGKRNLYPTINANSNRNKSSDNKIDGRTELNNRLIILNMADGENSLIDIAKVCNCSVEDLMPTIEVLEQNGILSYNEKLKTI